MAHYYQVKWKDGKTHVYLSEAEFQRFNQFPASHQAEYTETPEKESTVVLYSKAVQQRIKDEQAKAALKKAAVAAKEPADQKKGKKKGKKKAG